ncbi:MAG: acetyl-CoA carboxylase biotin carboxyl carrier protein [Candidatus Marinimicrobia bacterium]|nr:acetyl-CoA carboxylase biotin carboxyl carrier protein [Candidatus Neomarinimicrobiota bacterium]
MWQDKLKEIIYLLENSNVNEIETSFLGRRYRVVKKPAIIVGEDNANNTDGTVIVDDLNPIKTVHTKAVTESNNHDKILSPMPGTFYTASSPETPNYVKIGDKISQGDTLCIIEAMKIMNEIEAEKDGTIKSILVENAQPVEYNQPLFELE